MRKTNLVLLCFIVVSGCSASTTNIGSLVLPTSNRTIDVVQHRSDSKECAVGWVIQTYDTTGQLVDSKHGAGNALHCQLLGAALEAGGRVGAGAVVKAARTTISNVNGQSQGQGQGQNQGQGQEQGQYQSNVNTNTGDSCHGNCGGHEGNE